ncbi:DNA mismatch repair protein MutS [Erythrobacteraceae bacterium CFH 75059]|nr:DNA mismatch repair protein MutS [Erythrobacteraceae bacterium CFH 75059]
MMAQYLALRREAGECLLFYRMGDFYELFFDDARQAAAVLGIALTARGEHQGQPVPMCGVPVHAAEGYLARLIQAGFRVAVAEQTETPDEARQRGGSKALVARAIVRVVTAGTVTEEALLDPDQSNPLVALAEAGGEVGIACCEVSTGSVWLESCAADALAERLARLRPRELVQADTVEAPAAPAGVQHARHTAAAFTAAQGEAALQRLFPETAAATASAFTPPMLAAFGGLVAYLEHVGRGALPCLGWPQRRAGAGELLLDPATRASLEILVAQDGSRSGSLHHGVNRCRTSAGARLLAEDLSAPLTDADVIEARLAAVRFLHDRSLLRSDLRNRLKGVPDLARAAARLVAERGSPRDLGTVSAALTAAAAIAGLLGAEEGLPPLLARCAEALRSEAGLSETLSRALAPAQAGDRDGSGWVAPGWSPELDAARALASDARQALAALEAEYRETTGLASLKIKHNAVLGYFVEVPARHGAALLNENSGFTHRQTLAGTMRFNAPALHAAATRIISAADEAQALEDAVFAALVGEVAARAEALRRVAEALARVDVTAGLAERAAEDAWCRPEIVEGCCFRVEGGRHPVVERALAAQGQRFIANDCSLSADDRMWLIGGPNMGGKSTFLRQNALILLLAQAGSFVPARSARIGIADRIFSRVGASDNLAAGRSTFMVEMAETAAILTQATDRSFVILDEVGRGTSTYDGLAIAWAVAEAVHDRLRCRCLFATHYHELARLAERCEALTLHHVKAREWQGDLILLHELANGAADRSFGLAVAKLAGIPPAVIARAADVLDRLEQGRADTGGLAAGLGELPLFASAARQRDTAVDAVRATLDALDPDRLSPREALDLLYGIKQQLRGT